MERALPPLAERITEEDMAAIEDVLDAAASWKRGEMPWQAAAAIGALRDWQGAELPSYSRHVAMRVTPATDPRRADLMDLIDVLVRSQGYTVTRAGVFTKFEIRDNDAGWQYANLNERGAA